MESAASARNFRASTVHNWPGRDSTDVFTPPDYPAWSLAFVFRICLLTNTTKIQGQIEIKTKIQVQIQVQMQKTARKPHLCGVYEQLNSAGVFSSVFSFEEKGLKSS